MQINYNLLSYLSSVISKAPLKLKVLIVLLTGFGFLFSPLMAHADYSAPSWWNGDQCDSTHYNNGNGHTPQLLITWSGIQTCGYGPNQNPYNWSDVSVTMPGASAADYEWECTELVKRYLYLAYSATALSSTNGDQVVANYASNYPSKFKSTTNNTDSWHGFPNVGDVLSYSDVHTAIISGVTVTDQTNGNATLNLVEQNASLSGTTTQQVIGWKIKGDIDDPNDTGTDTVTAWLTPLQWSNNSPSGTTHDTIQAMATTVAAICLSPTTTMGLDGRNISPVTVVGVIPTISTELRQAHPAMHGLLEVMTLLVVTMLHWPSTGQVPRGLKLPAIALLQAGITTTCLA